MKIEDNMGKKKKTLNYYISLAYLIVLLLLATSFFGYILYTDAQSRSFVLGFVGLMTFIFVTAKALIVVEKHHDQ